MLAYYINLDRRPERRASMEARFTALGIEHMRIAALTPADVTEEQRRRYCNPLAYRWQTEGELACSLSHIAAMRAFLATPAPFAVILEDDTILSPALKPFLDRFEQQPPKVDVLRIETDNSRLRLPPEPETKLGEFSLFRLFEAGGGAAAYIVSRAGAERIASGEELLIDLTDQALFNPNGKISRTLRVLQAVPALAMQEDRAVGNTVDRVHTSDLQRLRHDRRKRDGHNFWRRSAYNFYDLIERDVIRAARKFWNKTAHGVAKREIPFKAD